MPQYLLLTIMYYLEADFMYQTLTHMNCGRSTMLHATVIQEQMKIIIIWRTVQYALMVLLADDSTHKLPT